MTKDSYWEEVKLPKEISFLDTTLRDGEQTPGVSLTPEEKLAIAKQLDRLGVDSIEAGFPITSKGEAEGVKLIANNGLNAEVCALARTVQEDIDIALDCDVDAVHTFIATSDIHMQYKLKMTREEVKRKAVEAVEYAKSHGVIVEFSAEDATRSDMVFLKEICNAVAEAKVDRIDIPDTVGIMIPTRMYKFVREVVTAVPRSIPVSVHCHDDLGMAVANSLVGLEAGARQVHATINGLGERAGNAALEEVIMALYSIYGRKTRIKMDLLYETSRLVSKLTGIIVQPNKAIVGDNAFAHESGIHTHGILSKPLTYEPISPDLVGRKRQLVSGKHSGIHGIKAELNEMGLKPNEEQLKEIVNRIKELGDKGKTVTDADLWAVSGAVIGEVLKEKKIIDFADFAVVTGKKVIPTASIKLIIDGKEFIASGTGVGPVDASLRAIQNITDSLVNVKLKEYRLEALTGGSNAVAEVLIKVEDKDGNVVSSRSAREDIVLASVEAMIDGINKLLLKRK